MRIRDIVEHGLDVIIFILAVFVLIGVGVYGCISSKDSYSDDENVIITQDNVIITQELVDTGKDYERKSQENGCEKLDILYDKETKLVYIRGSYRDVSPLMSAGGTQYKWNEDKGSLETK